MKLISLLFLLQLVDYLSAAAVVVYPTPKDEPLSADYQVRIGKQAVDVYTARVLDPPFAGKGRDYGGPYSFCNFDVKGVVNVRISSTNLLRNTVVRPAALKVRTRLEGDHTLVLSLSGPCKLSIEPDGKRGPLLLFANPLESKPPKQGNPDVIYFGPGVHNAGRIVVTNNQTLYLAGGATWTLSISR